MLKDSIVARQILDKNNRMIPVDDKKDEVIKCEPHLEALAAKRANVTK